MKKKRSRAALAPDITPLIDVVFLLLIFFMVSTVFKKDELALLLTLPETTKSETRETSPKSIYIEVSAQELAFNGKKTTLEQLETTLKGIQKKTTPVELRIDQNVKYQRVVKLLDLLKSQKLNNLALITDKD